MHAYFNATVPAIKLLKLYLHLQLSPSSPHSNRFDVQWEWSEDLSALIAATPTSVATSIPQGDSLFELLQASEERYEVSHDFPLQLCTVIAKHHDFTSLSI